jgi:glycosyltransferase involved in cell wall biosynthesis
MIMAAVLDELGFQIDVVDLDDRRNFNFERYQLIIGLGLPLVRYYRDRAHGTPVIFYSPGAHNYVQNLATLHRAEVFCRRYGRWLLDSCRFAESDFTSLAAVCDVVFALGNEFVRESYQRYTDKPVYILPAPCFRIGDVAAVMREKDWVDSRRHFLWFGGTGLIHKGLDLALEAFAELPDLHLHVCAPLHREQTFHALLRPLLESHANLHVHGYVQLKSQAFAALMRQCAFAINTSCSEGGGAATLNIMASGGLIPLVTTSSSIDTRDFGLLLADDAVKTLQQAGREVSRWPADQVAQRAARTAAYTAERHTPETFQAAFMSALVAVLKGDAL